MYINMGPRHTVRIYCHHLSVNLSICLLLLRKLAGVKTQAVNCIKTGIEEGDSSVVMGTLARPANVDDAADVTSVNNVKVVLDCNYNALYFSRAMIPHNKKGKYDSKCLYWRKLGIYSYRADFLHT